MSAAGRSVCFFAIVAFRVVWHLERFRFRLFSRATVHGSTRPKRAFRGREIDATDGKSKPVCAGGINARKILSRKFVCLCKGKSAGLCVCEGGNRLFYREIAYRTSAVNNLKLRGELEEIVCSSAANRYKSAPSVGKGVTFTLRQIVSSADSSITLLRFDIINSTLHTC